MIRLEPVNERTFKPIVDMKLPPEQNRFVAPNVVSLAQAWLYQKEARPYAILDGDTPVGFLMLDWDEGERTLGLWRFMIAHEQQHKGYGRQALQLVIQLARDTGLFDLLHLDYVPGNEHAQRLYASLGFRENGEVEDGEIIMTLPLTDHPKVGLLTADEEDLDDFSALIEAERTAGAPIAPAFQDEDTLKKAVADGAVKRLTLMGKTIGLALNDALLLAEAFKAYQNEALERLRHGA